MFAQGSHASWLLTCPATDTNFKTHLTQASPEELQSVLDSLPAIGNKTKTAVISREIRRRNKEAMSSKGVCDDNK